MLLGDGLAQARPYDTHELLACSQGLCSDLVVALSDSLEQCSGQLWEVRLPWFRSTSGHCALQEKQGLDLQAGVDCALVLHCTFSCMSATQRLWSQVQQVNRNAAKETGVEATAARAREHFQAGRSQKISEAWTLRPKLTVLHKQPDSDSSVLLAAADHSPCMLP